MFKFLPFLLLLGCTSQPEISDVVTVPTSEFGSVLCSTRARVQQILTGEFNERSIAGGLASNGSLMEVYVERNTRTWTFVLTAPNGVSCLIATGTRWRTRKDGDERGA